MGVDICELTPASQAFEEGDFFSVKNYYFQEAIASEDAWDRVYRSDAEFNARHNHITKKAAKETKLAKYDAGEQSKKAQTEGIRENRAEERDRERENNIWELDLANSENKSAIFIDETLTQSENDQTDEQYEAAPDYTDMLSEILNQQQNGPKNKK